MSECQTLIGIVPPPEPVWILPDIIPLGELVLLDGATGVGKSCFLSHVAAIESKRTQQPGDKGVLYITSAFQKDIRDHHLTRHGVDLGNIHEIGYNPWPHIEAFGKEDRDAPLLNHFLEFVEKSVEEHRPYLIIIDSLEEHLSSCIDARESTWRVFWMSLIRLAAQKACTIIVPRLHGRHEGRHYGLAARTGSELARHIVTLHWHPFNADKRVLTIAKNNKGPMGFQYHIDISPIGRMSINFVEVQNHVRPAKSPQTWQADPAHLDQTSEIFDQVTAKMNARPIRKLELEEYIVSLGFSKRAFHRTMSRAKLESLRRGLDWYYVPTLDMLRVELRAAAAASVQDLLDKGSKPRAAGDAGDGVKVMASTTATEQLSLLKAS